MPRGERTPPGPPLYPECILPGPTGRNRHAREGTRTCAHCREEFRKYSGRLRLDKLSGRPRMVSTVGSRRRVQALARLGWTQRELCARLGFTPSKMNKIMRAHDQVQRGVAEQIAGLYRDLVARGALGGDDRVQRYALRQGWAGPLDWDDIDNPAEVPLCVIEQAYAEDQEFERNRERRARRAARTEEQRQRDREANRAYKDAQRARQLAGVAA